MFWYEDRVPEVEYGFPYFFRLTSQGEKKKNGVAGHDVKGIVVDGDLKCSFVAVRYSCHRFQDRSEITGCFPTVSNF